VTLHIGLIMTFVLNYHSFCATGVSPQHTRSSYYWYLSPTYLGSNDSEYKVQSQTNLHNSRYTASLHSTKEMCFWGWNKVADQWYLHIPIMHDSVSHETCKKSL